MVLAKSFIKVQQGTLRLSALLGPVHTEIRTPAVYVGQAKQALKWRIAEHKTGIHTENLEYMVAPHYVNANHESASTLKFWGIKKISLIPQGDGTL